MQTAFSRIWTRITTPISYGDNPSTTNASRALIYKGGDKASIEKNRSVSLTSLIVKVYERIARKPKAAYFLEMNQRTKINMSEPVENVSVQELYWKISSFEAT